MDLGLGGQIAHLAAALFIVGGKLQLGGKSFFKIV